MNNPYRTPAQKPVSPRWGATTLIKMQIRAGRLTSRAWKPLIFTGMIAGAIWAIAAVVRADEEHRQWCLANPSQCQVKEQPGGADKKKNDDTDWLLIMNTVNQLTVSTPIDDD